MVGSADVAHCKNRKKDGTITSMTEKIIGYALLIVGIGVMIFSGVQIYMVFTNKLQPYPLFSAVSSAFSVKDFIGNTQIDPTKISQLPDQKIEIISDEVLNTSLNMTAHLLLMGFLLSLGFKVASLGVMLIRPLVVKVRPKIEDDTLFKPTSTPPKST